MRYLLLIYGNENLEAQMSEAEQNELFGAYYAYTNEIKASGKHLGGDALQPTTTATTVRVREGKTVTTDGPFAETKEQLGGFYMVEAENLDEAVAWAAKIPSATYGSIEVRPIMEFPEDGPPAG